MTKVKDWGNTMNFFIEFSYNDEFVFQRISSLINYIKDKKDLEELDCDDISILDFYSEDEINYYWWPTEEENKEFWEKYYSMTEEKRNLYLVNSPWDFESVIDAIITGEYEIIGCEVVESGIGRLYFEPWAYPYGGAEPLVQLIMPFNIKIIRVEK